MSNSSQSFTKIAEGVPGSEGPIFDRQGRFYCVAPSRGQVLRLEADGKLAEHANTGGVPAGLQLADDGSIWIADMKLGILRVHPDEPGRVDDVVREFEGKPVRGCNDLAFDHKGNLYFTAPAGSGGGKPVGEIFCRTAEGRVVRLDGGFEFCNGIAVSGDDRLLIVAETHTKKLWSYDIAAPGTVANKRHWATLSGEHKGGPDGIDFDAAGNLLSTNWGGSAIEVFDSTGKLTEKIQLPFDKPSNLHLGGPDGRDLWITEHTNYAVWKTRWRHAGRQ
jgi:gluconolactonase